MTDKQCVALCRTWQACAVFLCPTEQSNALALVLDEKVTSLLRGIEAPSEPDATARLDALRDAIGNWNGTPELAEAMYDALERTR